MNEARFYRATKYAWPYEEATQIYDYLDVAGLDVFMEESRLRQGKYVFHVSEDGDNLNNVYRLLKKHRLGKKATNQYAIDDFYERDFR